jgi:hypothetical protein
VRVFKCMHVQTYVCTASPSLFSQPLEKQLVYQLRQVPPLPFILKPAPDIPFDGTAHQDGDDRRRRIE